MLPSVEAGIKRSAPAAFRCGFTSFCDGPGRLSWGQGPARNALESAPNIRVLVLEDVFDDHIQKARITPAKTVQEIPSGRYFVGFDTFRKVLETDVDYVILETPPYFHHGHLALAGAPLTGF